MQTIARLLAACVVAVFCLATAQAQFFSGFSAANPADQETMDYAADLEGRAFLQWDAIRVQSEFSVATAAGMKPEVFRDGVAEAIRTVHSVQTCDVQPSAFSHYAGTWEVYSDAKRADEIFRTTIYYGAPSGPASGWKRPVVVVNDGMGAHYSIGTTPPRYTGENVGEILRAAGHPVLVVALKGFDDKYFRGGWGVSGHLQFDGFAKARGTSPVSIWIQDAYDAVCLMKHRFPEKQIGITGVSKSGVVAGSVALIHSDVDAVYLASGFSAYESKFYSLGSWSYGMGERVLYERNAILAALYDKPLRLSYSMNDDISYRVEAAQGRVLHPVNAVRASWGKPLVTQLSTSPSHYYSATDVTAFFGQ